MNMDMLMLISAAVIFVVSLLFIPKANRLQAQFIILFIQFPIWLLGLVVVEAGLLHYPVHELSQANNTSFLFEYLIFPIYCAHFNARFPQSASKILKLCYYFGASLLVTVVEWITEKYTQLIKYSGWTWYLTFLSVLFVLWLSRFTTIWFFKGVNPRDTESINEN